MPLTIKQYLKTRFPQLGTNKEMNGGDAVDKLGQRYNDPANKLAHIIHIPPPYNRRIERYNLDETLTSDGLAHEVAVGKAVHDAYVAAARVGILNRQETTVVSDAIAALLHFAYSKSKDSADLESILRTAQQNVAAELGVLVQI